MIGILITVAAGFLMNWLGNRFINRRLKTVFPKTLFLWEMAAAFMLVGLIAWLDWIEFVDPETGRRADSREFAMALLVVSCVFILLGLILGIVERPRESSQSSPSSECHQQEWLAGQPQFAIRELRHSSDKVAWSLLLYLLMLGVAEAVELYSDEQSSVVAAAILYFVYSLLFLGYSRREIRLFLQCLMGLSSLVWTIRIIDSEYSTMHLPRTAVILVSFGILVWHNRLGRPEKQPGPKKRVKPTRV